MRQEDIINELVAIKKELQKQKKAIMSALKAYNEVNYRVNKIYNKIKRDGKERT